METSTRALQSGKIVLVEDDEDVRRALTLLLRARGYTIDAYRSGVELLSSRGLPDADCLLVDYKMPQIDGLNLIGKLRDSGYMMPALMLTGFFSNTLKARAVAAGYDDVLEKPIHGPSLLDAISALISA